MKRRSHYSQQLAVVQRHSKQTAATQSERKQLSHPANVLRRAPATLRPADIFALQRTVGNRAVLRSITHLTDRRIQRVEETLDRKMELWSWLEQHLGVKGSIPTWRKATIAEFWKLVEANLAPTIAKVIDARTALNLFESYMVRPNPIPAQAALADLVATAPEIEGSPVIRTTDDHTTVLTLRAKLNWIALPRNNQWTQPLKAGLKQKKARFPAADKWQVYGEAIISEQGKGTKEERWKVQAANVAKAIKEASVTVPLDTWLDNVIAKVKILNRLWEEGTRTISGAHGSIPQETVKRLFRDYPGMTRAILTDGVGSSITGTGWGGVKYLSAHPRYARELKIHAMGGDYRVLSLRTAPTVLDKIGSIH